MKAVQNSQISNIRRLFSFENIVSIKKFFKLKSFPHNILHILPCINRVQGHPLNIYGYLATHQIRHIFCNILTSFVDHYFLEIFDGVVSDSNTTHHSKFVGILVMEYEGKYHGQVKVTR